MQASQLIPANQLAKRYGVKAIVYGAPGSGKTPLVATAPRPVMLVTEPGMLSMRHSNVPAWEAYTAPRIVEFMEWVGKSKELGSFDTIAIDSLTAIAELFLTDELPKHKHGMKAYGAMAERVMGICALLYYMPQKHVVMIAKQTQVENGKQTLIQDGQVTYESVMQRRPHFPGKDLNIRIPHLFDDVLHLGDASVPGQPKPVRALRTREIAEVFARDRAGTLNELEPPDLTQLFSKAMQ